MDPMGISGWWCNNHLLKKTNSQWEGLSIRMKWKIKNV
jgi:hypothetical protein